MSFLIRCANWLARAQLQIAGLAVLAILLNISLDVIMRALFNAPFSATTELVSYYYMIPVVFLPIMMLELTRSHIDTDLFYRMFPNWLKKLSRVVSGVISIGIYGLLAQYTLQQALSSTARGEVAMGVNMLPIWPVRWFLPVVFTLAAVTALLTTIQFIRQGEQDD